MNNSASPGTTNKTTENQQIKYTHRKHSCRNNPHIVELLFKNHQKAPEKENADIHQHFLLLTTYYRPKPISFAVI